MQHFDTKQLNDIKAKVNIVSLFKSQGITLRRAQGTKHQYIGLCPFHEDTNPSLSVNSKEGVFHCFGCGAGGDAIKFVEKIRGLGFQEAVGYLADTCAEPGRGITCTTPRSLSAAAVAADNEPGRHDGEKEDTFTAKEKAEALERVIEIYQHNLGQSSEALHYLKEVRGIKDNQVIRDFKIGYSNGNTSAGLSASLEQRVVKDSEQYKLLQAVGILNDSGREVFKGCLVFPVFSEETGITEIYARAVNGGRVKHLYLKGPHKGVFNPKAFKVYEEIILCEGIIDALTLFVNGFTNVSCVYGLNGLSQDIKNAILTDGITKIYFAFDNDGLDKLTARDKTREKALAYAKELPVTSKYINLPEGVKDINDYFVAHGYGADNFKTLIAGATLLCLPQDKAFDYEESVLEDSINFTFSFEEYVLEVKGVPKKELKAPLKVGIKTRYVPTGQLQYDTIDLFSARSRSMFVTGVCNMFGVTRESLEHHLMDMLALIEKRDKERVVPSTGMGTQETKEKQLTEEEKRLGLRFLKNKYLTREVVKDMSALGYVAEDTNKLLAYLVATSRKMDDPLAAIIVSRSSAGKSRLVDTVEELIPPEEVISITSASDQSFFYFKENGLSHKLISMGEHHGMENIEYHIRELLSAKEISKVVSMKNEEGNIETRVLRVKGPIAYFMTSTNPELNEENLSRCLLLYIDESREQTRRIMAYQRKVKQEGGTNPYHIMAIKKKHRIAQKLLRNIMVRIPYAHHLDFPDFRLDARRDHDKFLNLITVTAFLRQYQKTLRQGSGTTLRQGSGTTLRQGSGTTLRQGSGTALRQGSGTTGDKEFALSKGDVPYVDADIEDYRVAYKLFMNGILQNTMSDIPKMARDLHKAIKKLRGQLAKETGRKEKDILFTRKMVVEASSFSFAQVRDYMRVLEEFEVVEVVAGGMGGRHKQYRLLAEEDLASHNLSMIPSPEELEAKLKGKFDSTQDKKL